MNDTLSTFHFADIWEAVSDRVAERVALVCDGVELTYAELEARANRVANVLWARGVRPGDHVGIHLLNGPEYVESLLGCFKIRAVPINVNYRYVADELGYLFTDARVRAIVTSAELADRVVDTRRRMRDGGGEGVEVDAGIVTVLVTGDGPASGAEGQESYEEVLAVSSPGRDFLADIGERSDRDHYVIYTGGSTGMPKGVVWLQRDAFFACIGGGDPMRLSGPVDQPAELLDRIIEFDFCAFPVAPMMHAAAQWTSMSWWFCGAKVVLTPKSFDPVAVWRTVADQKVSTLIVVGDAMARPLLDAWDEAGPFDTSSLFAMASGGAPLTAALKDRLHEILPGAMITDGFGSSETGAQGAHRMQPGETSGGATRFMPLDDKTAVLSAEGRRVAPGSGEVGRVSLSGHVPLEYYRQPAKTAETFVEVDGVRWVMTGDLATVDEDGTIRLRGRSSQVINTGGEKVHPEEVEAALKSHPSVYDAVVVGVPHERFGEQVCAVVAPSKGTEVTLEELADHARTAVAGYKVPRALVVVERVERSPAGKPDYRWARELATGRVASGAGDTPTS
ncbi:MAG: acyl-CoA synthetase [Microthrixaceae bacterium]